MPRYRYDPGALGFSALIYSQTDETDRLIDEETVGYKVFDTLAGHTDVWVAFARDRSVAERLVHLLNEYETARKEPTK